MGKISDLVKKRYEQLCLEAENNPPVDTNEQIENAIQDVSNQIAKNLEENSEEYIQVQRDDETEFSQRNFNKWRKGFVPLRALINVSVEAVESARANYYADEEFDSPARLTALTSLHSRGIRVANECVCLMENGFADGAFAQWRSLYELMVVSSLIRKNSEEIAKRYLASRTNDEYELALEYREYGEKIGLAKMTDEAFENIKRKRDRLLEFYGDEMKKGYGWASPIVKNSKNVAFSELAKSADFEHWKPYYKVASWDIHPGFVPPTIGLGVSDSHEIGFLVGQSDAGMELPAQLVAIGLQTLSLGILSLKPNDENWVYQNLISDLMEKVQEGIKVNRF